MTRRMNHALRWLLLGWLTLVAACSDDRPGPQPSSVTPDRGDRANATPVQIRGRGFDPLVHSNYDDEAKSNISTAFSARLGSQALQGIHWVSAKEILALVPSGLSPGTYDLVVQGPSGAGGTLEDAFTVLASGDGGPGDGGPGEGGAADGPAGDLTPSEAGGTDAAPPTDQGTPKDGGPPGLANGAACTAAAQCASGHCVDGVCCNSACSGTCRACDLAGKKGSCSLVPAGSDPHADCAKQAVSTCGATGLCDGKGACAKYPSGTQCAAGSNCVLAWVWSPKTCDGNGTCADRGVKSCFPYDCNDSTKFCFTSCSSDSHCALLYGCDTAKKTCYSSCTTDAQCKSSGRCVNGNCWPN